MKGILIPVFLKFSQPKRFYITNAKHYKLFEVNVTLGLTNQFQQLPIWNKFLFPRMEISSRVLQFDFNTISCSNFAVYKHT